MLAAFTPAVKSPAPTTPEPVAVDQALNHFGTLVERVRAAADQPRPIHHVEEAVFRPLLVIGHSGLGAFLASSGGGDIGPILRVLGEGPSDPPRGV
jgi:hypothetical protein